MSTHQFCRRASSRWCEALCRPLFEVRGRATSSSRTGGSTLAGFGAGGGGALAVITLARSNFCGRDVIEIRSPRRRDRATPRPGAQNESNHTEHGKPLQRGFAISVRRCATTRSEINGLRRGTRLRRALPPPHHTTRTAPPLVITNVAPRVSGFRFAQPGLHAAPNAITCRVGKARLRAVPTSAPARVESERVGTLRFAHPTLAPALDREADAIHAGRVVGDMRRGSVLATHRAHPATHRHASLCSSFSWSRDLSLHPPRAWPFSHRVRPAPCR